MEGGGGGGGKERKPSGSKSLLETRGRGVKIGNSACLNRPFLRHVSPCRIVPAPLAETWPITTRVSWRRIRGIRPSSLRNASIGEARSNREQPDIDSNNPPPLPPPPKVGVELLQLFYRRSCKVFYGRAGETGGGGGGGGVTRWPWVIKIAGDGSMLSRINGGNSPRDGTIWLLYVLHPGYCCLPNFAARSPYEFLFETISLFFTFFKDFLGSKMKS